MVQTLSPDSIPYKFFIHMLLVKIIYAVSLILLLGASSIKGQQPSHKKVSVEPTAQADKTHGLLEVVDDRFLRLVADEVAPASVIKQTTVPFETPEPFLAVAPYWKSDRTLPDDFEIEVRGVNSDGESTNWYDSTFDPHYEAEEGGHAGQLIFLPDDTQTLQYRLTYKDTESPLTLKSLDFHFISPGATSESELQAYRETSNVKNVDSQAQTLEHGYPEPGYVDRETWGSSLDLENTDPNRVPMDATHLVVHHSATEHADEDWPAAVRSFYLFHTETNNWADIGYQWLVGGDGVMFQGRAFHDEDQRTVIGAHIGGQNTEAIGFCVIGNFSDGDNYPTEKAFEGLYKLLAWKADTHNINVNWRSEKVGMDEATWHIAGHRDYGATECPGHNLYPDLDMIRDNVRDELDTRELITHSEPEHISEKPDEFELHQNYPNPFNPQTVISYQLPEAIHVDLAVYTTEGRRIHTLVNSYQSSGEYRLEFNASNLASGSYLLRLQAGEFSKTRNMMFIK